MKTGLTIVIGSLVLGCGARDDATGDTGDATATSASDSADASVGSQTTASTAGTSGVESSTGRGDESTAADVPAACVEAGWDTSLAAYEALAEQAGDTYWYSRLTFEYIDDFQWACSYRTTIEFVAGAAARRTFELAEVADGTLAEDCAGTPFVEEGDAVGSMDGTFGATVYSMDQLYAGCCDLLALEPADAYSLHFEVAGDGVVAECYAIENGCGEGCEAGVDGFYGFSLEAFGFGSPP